MIEKDFIFINENGTKIIQNRTRLTRLSSSEALSPFFSNLHDFCSIVTRQDRMITILKRSHLETVR